MPINLIHVACILKFSDIKHYNSKQTSQSFYNKNQNEKAKFYTKSFGLLKWFLEANEICVCKVLKVMVGDSN